MTRTEPADEDDGGLPEGSSQNPMVVDPKRRQDRAQGPEVPGPDLSRRGARAHRAGSGTPSVFSSSRVARVQTFFTRELWSRELASLPTFRRWWYGVARVAHLTAVNFVKDRCTWRASALTYITVLSLVPMLALAFSVAKGLGAYQDLREKTIDPFLESTFGGEADADIAAAEAALAEAADGVIPAETPTDGAPTGETSGDGTTIDGSPDDAPEDAATQEAAAQGNEGTPNPDLIESAEASLDAAEAQAETPEGADQSSTTSSGETSTSAPNAAGDSDEQGTKESPDPTAPKEPPSRASGEGGAQVRAAIEMVLGFVDKTNVSQLGALGFLIVLYTVIKLLGSIEVSFNDIWGVRKARSLPRKLADYLSTVVLVPILLVTGTAVLGLAKTERFGSFLGLAGDSPVFATLSSLVVIWLGFAFAYILMPNTRTRITSALVGGVVGGTMWSLFQAAHLKLQMGVANYNAIYSTFAALPIFMIWVQTSWMTVLLGAEAAAAHQNQARHGQLVRSRDYDIAQKEVVALRLVARLTSRFLGGEGQIELEEVADELACPERTLEEVARSLELAGIVATVGGDDDDPALILARNPDRYRIQDVLDALKGPSAIERAAAVEMPIEGDETDHVVARAFARFRGERDGSQTNVTLRELCASQTMPRNVGE